jgi:hypothetical protein
VIINIIKKARKTDFWGFGEFSKNPFFGALRDIRLPSWKISVKIELLLIPPVGDIIKYICFQLV